MEAVGKLDGGRVPHVVINTTEYFRDIHDHLHRINTAIDTIRDTISMAIKVNKRLAAWAAIFAVATGLVGVWGMNFEHMPELKWQFGYPMAVSIVFLTCGYLYYRFRKSGWL